MPGTEHIVAIPAPPGRRPALPLAEIDALLDTVQAFPPSPYPLPELFKALMDPDGDLDRVVQIISLDPVLTARILQLCNSALLARGGRLQSVAEAIKRLGFQAVYQVTAAIKCPHIFQPAARAFGHDPVDLWKHSVMSAMMAQFIAEDLGEHAGLFFTAGLLHDLGKMILGQALRERYSVIVDESRANRTPLYKTEQKRLETDHAAVGARLLERWNFSPELVATVHRHHQPDLAGPLQRGAAIIQAASAFTHAAHPDENQATLPWEAESGLRILGWQMENLGRYWTRLEANMAMVKVLLHKGS